jgi:tetratricopeptide (TPR) repeat protein
MSRIARAYLALGSEWMAANTYQELLLASADFTDQEGAIQAGTELREYLLQHPLISPHSLYTEIVAVEPTAERMAGLADPARYWRHRAEFGLNMVYRVLLARPEEEASLLSIMDQAIRDMQRAANLDPVTHEERSEAFANGIKGWLYRQLGNQEFEAGSYTTAQRAYEQAINATMPQGQFATEILIDATLRAGLTALYQGDAGSGRQAFDHAIVLLAEQPNPQAYKGVVETVQTLLLKFTPDNERLRDVRDQVARDLRTYLAQVE